MIELPAPASHVVSPEPAPVPPEVSAAKTCAVRIESLREDIFATARGRLGFAPERVERMPPIPTDAAS